MSTPTWGLIRLVRRGLMWRCWLNVDQGRYPGVGSVLRSNLASLDHIVQVAAESGVDTGMVEALRRVVRRAVQDGYGEDDFSRVVPLLRTS